MEALALGGLTETGLLLKQPVHPISGHFGTGPTSNSTTAGFRFIVAGEIIHLLRANCISLEGRMIMSAQSSSATDRLLG
jgi:hypothetical protein